MLQLEAIILYCLQQLNGERTIYSIYHLLNGKKSSQTIQDAHLFSLKKYFGIYESLTRESFDEIIDSIYTKRWIYNCSEQRYLLTETGKSGLENNDLPVFLNGWRNQPFTSLFWERLSLLIQVASNLVFEQTRYLPIQKNQVVHQWLKSTLKESKVPRKELGSLLFSELVECFNEANEIDPAVLVFRLTGFQQIGLTPQQTAQKLNLNIHDYHIDFIHTLHFLLETIKRNDDRFRILPNLIHDFKKDNELTITARKTWKFLEQGYNLNRIAELRHLKLSTIEDHLVEFALHVDGFSIDSYVSKELQNQIAEISQQIGSRQLKLIKDKQKEATYFQIRLVLAKYGDR
jgi:uncharacterized protein YpbB